MHISFEAGTLQTPPLVDSCFNRWSDLIPFRSALKFAFSFLIGINLELGRLYQPNSFPKRPLSTTIPPTQKNQRGPGVWCPDIFLYYETFSCFLLQIYALPAQFFSKTSTFYNDTPNSKKPTWPRSLVPRHFPLLRDT